ncbi:M4 family metallopeptidase [Microbacterium sp. zg.Y625]|uniref:M4 family metallopeptidase n=1 Tax=Microbacterium jiangjiandongii TaxID=3049071 RepID=UPI00214AEB46|nr:MULTISPECIES: M4 family metallopeptidase [unclassified Microbacterium]MCR2793823.1 M4 family metallopeptidase [Microbacterium sp. zg.Y625]WIM26163.1 M4 family metallopeptidase [Microbacterium sp. zg-Y625]
MNAIVPPYLLARLAATEAPHLARAAQAARATLEAERGHHPDLTRLRLSIDESGSLVADAAPSANRAVSDAQHQEVLPGVLVRAEGDDPTGDDDVDQAYDGLGITFDFFWDAFGRAGIDGVGGTLAATVRYGVDFDNAFWNGERVVFGDGDGEVFTGFTDSLTVIAHELAHGVTEYSGGLVYEGQSGALNESVSDVFGALAEQHHLGQRADDASWLIGAGIFTDAVQGRALRSLAEPGTAYDDDVLGRDPQPGHMRDYVETTDDNGGVHINSGIPNRAFHLAATALGGFAWERAGRIWYLALTGGSVSPTSDFAAFARVTLAVAVAEYGEDSEEVAAVRAGWSGVGVIEDAEAR